MTQKARQCSADARKRPAEAARKPILVVGHRNPDNDSICSAVAYAYLKNQLAARLQSGEVYVPVRLGPLPAESEAVLARFGVEPPAVLSHVHARVADVMTPDPLSIAHDATLLEAGRMLRAYNVRSLVVENDDGTYRGLISTRMIAERYIAATDLLGDENGEGAETKDSAEGAAGADSAEGAENGEGAEKAENAEGSAELEPAKIGEGVGPVDVLRADMVAADLIRSLSQKVSEILETDVVILHAEDLLKDAVESLLASALREAVVLDEAGYCIGIVTRTDIAIRPKRRVILVDHNEIRQAAAGIEEAQVVEIIDHHRIADVSTSAPIQFMNLPVGSTATIIAMEYQRCGVDVPPAMAGVLLSAIMTDTVVLKSPTTTPIDHEQAARLGAILGLDPQAFGLEVFKCRGNDKGMPVEEMVGTDAKEFLLGDATVLISQHETIDLVAVMAREDEIRAYLRTLRENHGYDFVLFAATDIFAEGSTLIAEGNTRVPAHVFGAGCAAPGGVWLPGVLSRKKQIVPRLFGE